jgi:hypothetical protein
VAPADELRVRVLLSLQRALLGEVPPALRGVRVGWSPTALEFVAYFDGPIAEVDAESMSVICAEVNADFLPEEPIADFRCLRCDAPAPLAVPTEWTFPDVAWVYLRRES